MFNLHFDGHPRLYDPHENVPRAKNEASPIKHFSHLKKRQGDPMGSLKKLVTGWKQAKLRCHISDLCFRHETPVLSKPIEVVHLSEELVVLDKPCSLPVSLYFNLSCDKKGKVEKSCDDEVCLLFPRLPTNPHLPSGVERGTFVRGHH